ncbi:MAG TPA: hypothetical protein VI911_01065 [Patescibacteria group bacterium]|nr:hypothetical protein [Patescibacteria group bacterium]
MVNKSSLVLMVSPQMDNNKKEDRNEHGLVRMTAKTRALMGFKEDTVELWNGESDLTRIKSSTVLSIFKAFSADIAAAKALVEKGELDKEAIYNVAFVTTRTYQRIMADHKNDKNIWVTDGVADTVIGADPEFLLFTKEGLVRHANSIAHLKKDGLIGFDGAMAEIRPDPAVTPEGLVKSISSIFHNDAYTKPIMDFDWKSGVYHKDKNRDYPIGGHIHIGNPAKVARISADERELFFRVLNKILDELLSLPMMRLDGEAGTQRRTKCQMGNYGYFGAYRVHDGRLEYRTLSGLWLAHPTLTKIVMGVAKAIIDDVYYKVYENQFAMSYMCPNKFKGVNVLKADFDSWDGIPLAKDIGCVRTSKVMFDLINKSDAKIVDKAFVTDWYTTMRGLSSYEKYRRYIDDLKTLLSRPLKELQNINTDIKAGWLDGEEFSIKL